MSSDEALAARAKVLTAISADRAALLSQADSFVVVSLWRARSGDGTSYDYEPHGTLNEALNAYAELERGEYERARAIGIFPARNGLPIGPKFDPAYVMRLMAETRKAA